MKRSSKMGTSISSIDDIMNESVPEDKDDPEILELKKKLAKI
jgi:hypothetical protein